MMRIAATMLLGLVFLPGAAWSSDTRTRLDYKGEGEGEPRVTLRGFGTLGAAYQPDAGAGFLRDFTQPSGVRNSLNTDVDSRLALQLDARLAPQLDATIQVVTRYRYDGSYRPELAWGFVRYTPQPDLEVRVGRLGWDVYMLSDSRDVGYSYLWVRPPVEYYGTLQLSKLNGADVVLRRALGEGVWSGKLFAGEVESRIPLDKRSYSSLGGSWLYGGYVDYQSMGWQFRLGVTRLELKTELRGEAGQQLNALRALDIPGLSDFLDAASLDTSFQFFTAGVAYDSGPVQVQMMYSYTRAEENLHEDLQAGYFSVGYRMGRWTPYAYVSSVKSTGSRSGPSEGASTVPGFSEALLEATSINQRTVALGARYELTANAALKFQADFVRVRDPKDFVLAWSRPDADWNGRATVFSATLDFVF